MSYGGYNPQSNPYNQGGGGGYGGNNSYGSPTQGNPYGSPNPYGGNYASPSQAQNPFDERNETVEMSSVGGNANRIRDMCKEVTDGVDQIKNLMNQLSAAQRRFLLNESDGEDSRNKREVEGLNQEIRGQFKVLADTLARAKKTPGADKVPQIGVAQRQLTNVTQQYQQLDAASGRDRREQLARQYRLVRPEASAQEVKEAVEDGSGQIFQQALMQGNRMGQLNSAISASRARLDVHLDMMRTVQELAQMAQQVAELVAEQEVQVEQITHAAEQTVEDIKGGNEELEVAVKTARSTRRKKWICFGICMAIILIIVLIVIIYMAVNGRLGGNNNNKRDLFRRSVLDDLKMNNARAVEFAGEAPDVSAFSSSKIVIPGRGLANEKRYVVWEDPSSDSTSSQ